MIQEQKFCGKCGKQLTRYELSIKENSKKYLVLCYDCLNDDLDQELMNSDYW